MCCCLAGVTALLLNPNFDLGTNFIDAQVINYALLLAQGSLYVMMLWISFGKTKKIIAEAEALAAKKEQRQIKTSLPNPGATVEAWTKHVIERVLIT